MRVDDLVRNLQHGLRAIVPEVERAGIPWKRPDAYDEWDELASATYQCLVVSPLRDRLPESDRLSFRLPKYDLLLESYSGYRVIEVDPGTDNGRIRVFHALATTQEPFDAVEWRPVASDGRPLSTSLEVSPLAGLGLALRQQFPVEHRPEPELGALDIKWDRVAEIYDQATKVPSHYVKFVLFWIILNHFFATLWDAEHPNDSRQYKEKDALNRFSSHPQVEAMRQKLMEQEAGGLPVELPVTRWGRPVTEHAGRKLASELGGKAFFDILYAVRNNIVHGAKASISESDRTNIEFASRQTQGLVELIIATAGGEGALRRTR